MSGTFQAPRGAVAMFQLSAWKAGLSAAGCGEPGVDRSTFPADRKLM